MNRWSLKRTVDPTSEPITPSDVIDHCGIPTHDQDAWLLRAIRAAREFAEIVQHRQFMTATWRLTLDEFPSWEIKVPMPPLQSVSSITYLDTGGTSQTLGITLYTVSADAEPTRITPAYGQVWPSTRYQLEAVKVTFVAGYTSANLIPQTTIIAMTMMAADLYEHREYTTEAILKYSQTAVSMLEAQSVLDFSGPLGVSCGL